MRVYLDGKEIDEVPELREICALSNDLWFQALMQWLVKNRPGLSFEIIVGLESTDVRDGQVLEMWIPEAPANRDVEIGGILKKMVSKKGTCCT